MTKAFQMALLALDWFPGYKRMVGGALVVAAAAGAAYNSFGAPAFGTPVIPVDVLSYAQSGGSTLLALGVATSAAR